MDKFSNKGSQTLSNTEVSISERAKRRIRQNIALSTRDLPINPIYIHQGKSTLGFEVINRSRWFNGIMVSTSNDLVNVDSLQSLPFVLDVIDFEVQSFEAEMKKLINLNSLIPSTMEMHFLS